MLWRIWQILVLLSVYFPLRSVVYVGRNRSESDSRFGEQKAVIGQFNLHNFFILHNSLGVIACQPVNLYLGLIHCIF